MGAVNLEANSSGDIADSLGYKTSRFLKKKNGWHDSQHYIDFHYYYF